MLAKAIVAGRVNDSILDRQIIMRRRLAARQRVPAVRQRPRYFRGVGVSLRMLVITGGVS